MADQVKSHFKSKNSRSLYWASSTASNADDDGAKPKRKVRFREAVPMAAAALLVHGEQCVLRCQPVDNPSNPPSSSSNTSSDSPIRNFVEGDLLTGANMGTNSAVNNHFSSSSSSCCSPVPLPSTQQTFRGPITKALPPSMSTLTSSSTSLRYKCMCGGFHVVIGTKCFLVLYVWLTVCGLVFGMVSAMVWALIPLIVIPISVYGLCNHKPKYLYPLLIVTVIQLLVCLIMVIIVGIFALFNYNTLLAIFAHSATEKPSSMLTLVLLVTILGCFILAGLFFWQILVISSCIQYYECWQRHHPSQTSTKAAKFNLNDRVPTTHSLGAMTGDGTYTAFNQIVVERKSCIDNSEIMPQIEMRTTPPDTIRICHFERSVNNHSVLTSSTALAVSQPNISPSHPDLTVCESKS